MMHATRLAGARSLLLISTSAAALAGAPLAAHAAEADATSAAEPAQAAALDEIIVTARKRDENIQNIPVAVTAVSSEKLDRFNLRSIEGIAASTPQLNVVRGNSGSGATISLRGIGSTFTSVGIEQSVAVNLDGVYYGQGRIINEGFFDMKQVEILRGPQALFFGKNATAGVLSFQSADPGNHFEALARAGYEFKGKAANYEGVISGPITDQLGLRLAVRYSDQTGAYMHNDAPAKTLTTLDVANGFAATVHQVPAPVGDLPQEKDFSARLTAKYTPSDQFSLTLKGGVTKYRTKNATWNYEMTDCPLGRTQVNPTETCNADRHMQQNPVPTDIAATNGILNRHDGQLYQDYDAYALSAKAAYTADKVNITSVTGLHRFVNYFLGDYDFTGGTNGGTWGFERSKYLAFSEEIRAQTTLDGPLNFMTGIFAQTTRMDFLQQIIFPGALANSAAPDPSFQYLTLEKLARTDGNTLAGFGQVQWKITPTLALDVGARLTHETKDSTFTQPYVVPPFQAAFRQGHVLAANQKFHNFSPEATLTWTPSEDWTAFASYKHGYKSGGFSISALDSVTTTVDKVAFSPEKVKGFEGGLRAFLANHTLRLALDAYAYEYTDLQVDYFDAPHVVFITRNAGSSTARGVEFEAEWAPPAAPGLVLRGTLAYNRARYKSFPDAPCWGGQTPAQGCTIDATGSTIQDLGGKPTALAPKWTGALEANYEHDLTQGLVFGASANLRYSSSYFGNPWANPFTKQSSFTTIDASLRLRTRDQRLEFALIGKNLTDKYVATYISDAPSSGSGTGTAAGVRSDLTSAPNLPRTIAVQVTWKY
ncbi:TonB-dependent receptor [Phenylobacterium sp. LjRoot225]|uniref:TonB-dependent receptor n=1 Tax=Phenylobacterium sp. LjRoot225 TaxID=3342285 RepID=UPI003ECC47B0